MNLSNLDDDRQQKLRQIISSAKSLGVEMDEEEAIQWLTTIAALRPTGDKNLIVDEHSGVYAHWVVLLDFDPADLERIRRVADIIQIHDRPKVETAISLSGSSAQSHVQSFPGDFDYFERVNIKAPTREDACKLLGQVIREKALESLRGPGYQLIEVRFGTFPFKVFRDGEIHDVGGSITWSPAEIEDGKFDVLTQDGENLTIDWDFAVAEPGWCKLDWVLVDPAIPRAIKASNMIDATWEDPKGKIHTLDGFLDPYYQEVYLDAESIPLFSKITRQIEPSALGDYIQTLEKEIRKYTYGDRPNYGKAAKRLYNVFRLTGRFEEAAYVRELFDEPAALLYQVSALLDGLADLGGSESSIDRETLLSQIDHLIRDVVSSAEGPEEVNLVMSLIQVRDDITGVKSLGDDWENVLIRMQIDINGIVNSYFENKLRAIPDVADYIDNLI